MAACRNHQVRTDLLDLAVWREVCALLEHPQRLEQEYRQRLRPTHEQASDQHALEQQRTKLRQGLSRLIDSYTEGFLDKQDFESRITRQRQRIAALDEQARQLADATASERELRLVIGRLEDFAAQVEHGLQAADWLTRREIIRTLVSRVEIDHTQVNVVFRVPPDPFAASPDRGEFRGQYSFLSTKNDPRIVPASLDFCLANLNCASSSGTSIPSDSFMPTARLPVSSGVYRTLISRPLS